ncbi:hypothetical protein DFQ28_005192 [Apophysomyces sp. BC1034]|nr:hypothetical protein DFQ30_005083 [Apophysomyces sp. BC1015]KAG0177995.1 hypothetical protein DFQ29_004087 [Apophysomyces sp. BC1021]KAG0188234.1 hypothetical protein DFQ28_005192 [Apophysomyces sp. BC1034]
MDQYDLSTIVNKSDFQQIVEFKQCPDVGRSLVAQRQLVPGEIILIEKPLLQYPLQPDCRSSVSPHFSKTLWKELNDLVRQEENGGPSNNEEKEKEEEEEEVEEESDEEDEEESDEEDEEEEDQPSASSSFCPGVPAAMLAYLAIAPESQTQYDFFYYPEDMTHETVKLVHRVAQMAVEKLDAFRQVDPKQLSYFVLKIYGNAHTIAYESTRTQTHKCRKERQRLSNRSQQQSFCPSAASSPRPAVSRIALLSWGSKFAHSCAPNMFLQYEPATNAMVYTVIRPVAAGELLTFSYLPEDDRSLGGLVCGTRVLRQQKLWQFKFFDCACSRCTDWDWGRGVACDACAGPMYSGESNSWTCQQCAHQTTDASVKFLQRESRVQQVISAFAARIYGTEPVGADMIRMIEPYLEDLLCPEDEDDEIEQIPIPPHHWTYNVIHSLLATYHLKLFPQSFGKGLASRLGMTSKGLGEAAIYINFLNNTIWAHGNHAAAFFAGWRLLAIVVDVVLEGTQKKKFSSGTDSSDDEGEDQFDLVPMPEDWMKPIQSIIHVVEGWLPLITEVFKSRRSSAVDEALERIHLLKERVNNI